MDTQKRKKIFLIVLIVALPLIGIASYAILLKVSGNSSASALPVADWQLLKELNLETGQASEKLKALDGLKVRSPGFMVPLEDNSAQVTEFLLVPTPQACIHVPAPPPNQIILVRMDSGKSAKIAYGPIWVEGILRINTVSHQYGKASFQLLGDNTEAYKVQY